MSLALLVTSAVSSQDNQTLNQGFSFSNLQWGLLALAGSLLIILLVMKRLKGRGHQEDKSVSSSNKKDDVSITNLSDLPAQSIEPKPSESIEETEKIDSLRDLEKEQNQSIEEVKPDKQIVAKPEISTPTKEIKAIAKKKKKTKKRKKAKVMMVLHDGSSSEKPESK